MLTALNITQPMAQKLRRDVRRLGPQQYSMRTDDAVDEEAVGSLHSR